MKECVVITILDSCESKGIYYTNALQLIRVKSKDNVTEAVMMVQKIMLLKDSLGSVL